MEAIIGVSVITTLCIITLFIYCIILNRKIKDEIDNLRSWIKTLSDIYYEHHNEFFDMDYRVYNLEKSIQSKRKTLNEDKNNK